jgi:uncharacterized protein (DUF302 family)
MTKKITDYAFRSRLDLPYEQAVERVTCNPPLAHQALQTELEIGLLLPCNVIVHEEGDGSMVSIVDPISMLGVVENPELGPVASEARAGLRRVLEALNA